MAVVSTEGGMSFTLPNLDDFVQWFKSRIKPEDPKIGSGISDWTITAEYVPNLEVGGTKAFGALCSPSDPALMITPEDVAAKRAHFRICTPENERDVQEMYETFRHECEHILQSMYAKLGESTRGAMENHAHSMGNFIAQLTPEEILLFPRWKLTPMARAYRAKDTPDMDEEDKDKQAPAMQEDTEDKDKQAPAMQEGASRDVATITADLIKAAMAGQPTDELVKELVAAQALAGASGDNGPASAPEPVAEPPPPTMGMKPEEAYARGKSDAEKRSREIDAIVDAHPHLNTKQRAMVRRQTTIADAKELAASYPRTSNQEPARMGMQGNPKAQGANAPRAIQGGLPAEESAAMARKMGAKENKPQAPHINARCRFSMGNMTPTQLREAIAKGNDPRNLFPSTLGA
jgi:hypothetical protein